MIPGCCKWYHQSCLDWGPELRISSTEEHLATLRATGIELLKSAPGPLPVDLASTASVSSLVDVPNLPEQIYRAAEASITRGTSASGIVGDARRILLARDIIVSAGEATISRVVEWQENYGDEEGSVLDQRKEVWMCPDCSGVI